MTKVKAAIVLTTDATNVGEVYLKLAKYKFKVNPTLKSSQHLTLSVILL